jgi:hypothetical protein
MTLNDHQYVHHRHLHRRRRRHHHREDVKLQTNPDGEDELYLRQLTADLR